jgi:hypothetical protein
MQPGGGGSLRGVHMAEFLFYAFVVVIAGWVTIKRYEYGDK